MSHSNVTTLFTGYNTKYKMTKCLDTGTLVNGLTISSNFLDVNFNKTVNPGIIEALASLGLYSLVENDLNVLQLEERLEAISTGIFAARRKGNEVVTAPKIPETINQLPLATIEEVQGDSLVQVKLSVKDLAKYGLLDNLPAKTKATLQKTIDLQLENAERIKVLFELFKIANASIVEETETSLVFACAVSSTLWNSTFTKIKSSADRGWAVDPTSVKLDESFINFEFNLTLDKTINPVAE